MRDDGSDDHSGSDFWRTYWKEEDIIYGADTAWCSETHPGHQTMTLRWSSEPLPGDTIECTCLGAERICALWGVRAEALIGQLADRHALQIGHALFMQVCEEEIRNGATDVRKLVR